MKRFLIKCLFLATLAVGTFLAVYSLPIPYKDQLAAILDKRDLLKEHKKDRIIFVGGSGLYCGLDSEMLQKKLDRPVINMGLYYGFGITPLLKVVKPYLRSGDVVVVIPEYSVIFDHYDAEARKWIYRLGPSFSNILPVYENTSQPAKTFALDVGSLVLSKLEAIPLIVRDDIRTKQLWPMRGGYFMFDREFTPSGDSLKGFPSIRLTPRLRSTAWPEADCLDQSFTALNAFCRDMGRRGVTTYFIFPAFASEEYKLYSDRLKKFERRLRSELECPILGQPKDFLYPIRLFSNTDNHLNVEGKRLRSRKVGELLQKALARTDTDRSRISRR